MVNININQTVKFKVNERGLRAMLDKGHYFHPDDDGFYYMQLHTVIRIFGEYMGVDFWGSPILDNILTVVE